MLPPSVPRFWICAAPMVAAASTSAGRCSRQTADRRISVYVVSAPIDTRVAVDGDPAQLVEAPQVEHPLGRLAELAGERDHQVRAAGDRPSRRVGEGRVRLGERARAHDRRLDRHRSARPRSAPSPAEPAACRAAPRAMRGSRTPSASWAGVNATLAESSGSTALRIGRVASNAWGPCRWSGPGCGSVSGLTRELLPPRVAASAMASMILV